MKVARVNSQRLPILTGTGGLGGANQSPPAGLSLDDLVDVDTSGVVDGDVLTFEYGEWIALPGSSAPTTMWVPVMTEVDTDVWSVLVTGDGDAVMTEVPL